MRRVLLTFSFFLTTVSNLILAQDSNWSLGLQVGRSQLIGFTGLSFEQNFDFEAQGMGGVILQLYGKYFITEKVSIQAGGGINNLVSGMRFYNRRSNNLGTRGVTQQYFMGLDYDIPFGKSDFGLLPRISFAMTGSNARSKNGDVYNFGPKEFSLGGVGILHIPTGEYEDRNIYLRELQIRASNYKFIYHIRPEISIYKNFGPHRILISAVRAFAPDRDYYIEEYNFLEFKEVRHTAFHRFGGHYTALLFGYEFRF